jgi:hypothetical protein
MNIFISWSGDRSKTIAEALHRWLKGVIQSVEPWMSGKDIAAGSRWNAELWRKLAETNFGIVCLTPENCSAPWLLFEAGALAKTLDNTFVCPYLIGLAPTDVPAGPLTQFQAKQATYDGTWDLVESINKARKGSIRNDLLKENFELWWPKLERSLNELPDSAPPTEMKQHVLNLGIEAMHQLRGSRTFREIQQKVWQEGILQRIQSFLPDAQTSVPLLTSGEPGQDVTVRPRSDQDETIAERKDNG